MIPALRRQVAQRISELDEALRERRQRLAHLSEQLPSELPHVDDVATMLAGLPILADRLQLEVAYHPAESALDVALTLYSEERPGSSERMRQRSVWCPRWGLDQSSDACND